MLEYALLLGVVIAGILIMQVFVKRSFQGGLKDAGDKIGDQFSAGGTTISQERNMHVDQEILEVMGTNSTGAGIGAFADVTLTAGEVTITKGVYSLNKRTGGNAISEVSQKTDSAKEEQVRWNEYSNTTYADFTFGNF